ncbi:MAG: hypothetical protein EZS28_018889, partial [Streblomastix strix]
LKSNIGTRDKSYGTQHTSCQTDWRMEDDIRLQNTKQGTYCQTLQDGRHMRYDLDAEKRGLDEHVGCNVCLQNQQSQSTTATKSSVPNTRNQLHISGDAVWDKYCAIYICENNTTNNREGEIKMQNIITQLCGQYNTVQQQTVPNLKGNSTDNNNIRRYGLDYQSKQEQTGSQEINNFPRMELEHRINDVVNNKTNEEAGDGSSNQISTVDTVAVISNRKKRGRADWTNSIYKSSIHTKRSSYHVHESGDEQMSKQSRMRQPNQVIEKSFDRSRMVDDINQEQWTKKNRNIQDLSNDINGYIFREMESNLTNTRRDYTKGIQTVENKDPNIEQKGNNSDYISIELFLANIVTQPFALPDGKAKVGLRRLIDQILLYIDEQQCEVKFRHIPGVKNTEADSLSRLAVSEDNSINKQVLQQVLEEWEIQITIDCFATRRNAKHLRYFSIENNALIENWNGVEPPCECEIPLLHCPISLIPTVIYKVELEQEKGIIIAPI